MNDEPKQQTGGGRPYRSILNPHYDRIAALRAEYATWDEVAAALGELGVRITAAGVRQFVTRRLGGRRVRSRLAHLLGPAEPAPKPRPTARTLTPKADENPAAAEFSPKPTRLEMPLPTPPERPVLYDPA